MKNKNFKPLALLVVSVGLLLSGCGTNVVSQNEQTINKSHQGTQLIMK